MTKRATGNVIGRQVICLIPLKIDIEFRRARWIGENVSTGRAFPSKVWPVVFWKYQQADFSTKLRPLEKKSGIQLPRWYSLPVFLVRKKDVCKSNSYRETYSIEVSLYQCNVFFYNFSEHEDSACQSIWLLPQAGPARGLRVCSTIYPICWTLIIFPS